jgi:hypothetical protein
MRKLTRGQKCLIRDYINEFCIDSFNWDDMNFEYMDRIIDLNDYETLWSDANRFGRDVLNGI